MKNNFFCLKKYNYSNYESLSPPFEIWQRRRQSLGRVCYGAVEPLVVRCRDTNRKITRPEVQTFSDRYYTLGTVYTDKHTANDLQICLLSLPSVVIRG